MGMNEHQLICWEAQAFSKPSFELHTHTNTLSALRTVMNTSVNAVSPYLSDGEVFALSRTSDGHADRLRPPTNAW